MATMTQARRTVKPRLATQDASGTCRMVLTIKGTDYTVRPLPDGADGERGYRLRNLANGNSYVASQDATGYCRCECADFEYRRSGTGTACKHIAVLQTFGMLPKGGGA